MAPPKAKEIDPEEQMRRKFRAKCQFRALGRLVMANAYWLIEGVDHYEGVEDVKRRVQQAVRGKVKKKQLLNINDKALLNKAADERTDQEKQYLYRIIGGLKCFKRYPNHVKKKLAAVTYYKYYGPDRVIVRQHQEAHALYFIVNGDVIVSQMIYDELLQKYVSVDIGAMHAGDMFGEVSLLHNIPRTATCTTNGHCELLQLMKEDFKSVLQASVQKQWDEVRRAMSAFTYFDGLDEVARREGCIVARMKSYAATETLLGDGVGIQNFVYFILSGRCQMVESIRVIVTKRLGKEFYTLYDPYIPKEESEQDFDEKYFGAYKQKQSTSRTSKTSQLSEQTIKTIKSNKDSECLTKTGSADSETRKSPQTSQVLKGSHRSASLMTQNDQAAADDRKSDATTAEAIELSSGSNKSRIFVNPTGIRLSLIPEMVEEPLPSNLRTYFMQVCQLNPGSSFGFGENMRDRRIVALTPVDCMLMPKIWLLQRNTANIWTRIQHYLEKKIPTKKDLFKEFVSARQWQNYREEIVTDVVSRSNTVNATSVHDVPYSIRMEEMLDI